MPKKKKQKIRFEDLGGYVLDDDGNRREIGTVYPEKFSYKGHANVFKVIAGREGDSVMAVACEGEIADCLIMEKGPNNFTDEDLDRKWQDIIITEDSPPFKSIYTIRSKRRLIQELYELGLKRLREKEQQPPESGNDQ